MSLLLDLLRHLLEYFGIQADFLVPVWDNRPYGCSRSIVRMIGTSLPLSPSLRVHFQVVRDLRISDYGSYTTYSSLTVPSFADVLWIAEDEGEMFTRIRNKVHLNTVEKEKVFQPALQEKGSLHAYSKMAETPGKLPSCSDEALKKITALEDELTRLRAKIAKIITVQEEEETQEGTSAILHPPNTPGASLPPPTSTSTPVSITQYCSGLQTQLPPVPPPLPPSLPPPPLQSAGCSSSSMLAVNLTKERCNAKKSSELNQGHDAKRNTASIPRMIDVLKDMSKITLRATERSPGGTPVKRKDKKLSSLSDPAALIADALKRKFAHTHSNDDSTDTENRSFEPSPFSSPEMPKFVPQMQKPSGKHILSRSDKITQLPAVKVGGYV